VRSRVSRKSNIALAGRNLRYGRGTTKEKVPNWEEGNRRNSRLIWEIEDRTHKKNMSFLGEEGKSIRHGSKRGK